MTVYQGTRHGQNSSVVKIDTAWQESNLDQKSGASNRPHALRYDKNIIDSFLYECSTSSVSFTITSFPPLSSFKPPSSPQGMRHVEVVTAGILFIEVLQGDGAIVADHLDHRVS